MAFTIERFLCKFSLNEGFYLITQALWGAIHEQSNTVVTVKTKHTDIGVTGAEQHHKRSNDGRGLDEGC